MRLLAERLPQRGMHEVGRRVRLRGRVPVDRVDDARRRIPAPTSPERTCTVWLMSPLTGFWTSSTSRSKPLPTMLPGIRRLATGLGVERRLGEDDLRDVARGRPSTETPSTRMPSTRVSVCRKS